MGAAGASHRQGDLHICDSAQAGSSGPSCSLKAAFKSNFFTCLLVFYFSFFGPKLHSTELSRATGCHDDTRQLI